MNREVFIVKNITSSDIEIKSFGIIIPSGQTIELGNFDNAILSNEIYNYISNGSLVRLINNVIVDSGSSYYQSIEPYSLTYNNIITVSKTGGTFNSIQSAIDSITDESSSNRYLIDVGVGEFIENISIKNYISIKGQGFTTKIIGKVSFTTLENGVTELLNLIVENTNEPSLYINTLENGSIIYTRNTVFRTYWDNGSIIQSVFDIESGKLYFLGSVATFLYNTNTGSTNGIDSIFYIHGTNQVEIQSSETISYLYEYSNTNECSLIYNTNSNFITNESFLKDGRIDIILNGEFPENLVKIIYHSGSTSISTVNNYMTDIVSNNETINIAYMPAYNNWSIQHLVSGQTIGSEIYMGFCTFTWDQTTITDDSCYLGVAISENLDWVEYLNCIFDTNFDVIPSTYDLDGISSGFTLNISNSWGVYYNNNSVSTDALEIGHLGVLITDISNDSGLTSDSEFVLPTEQAVKRYVDFKVQDISTGTTISRTEFNTYTGQTDIRLQDIENDITGLTETKLDKNIFYNYTGLTGLQEITEINSRTNIESTFDNGIILSKIKSSGNTNIDILNSGDTSIININVVSGLTGFGTNNQKGLIHAFGTNIDGGIESNYTQTNSIIVDGIAEVDKDINWSENGEAKWLADTYRNEKSKFWYLYNVTADNVSISVSENGRIGLNKQPNTMNMHSSFIGVNGLNDMHVTGVYDQNYNSVYEIVIDTTGSTDTFKWRKSIDGAITFGNYSNSINVSLTNIDIENGIQIYFHNISGHTIGSVWQFGAFTQLPDASFTVAPIGFNEVLITDDYTSDTIIYNDVTSLANGGTNNQFILFKTGSTTQSLYIGSNIQLDSIYISLLINGSGVILITEYWNGSIWKQLNNDNNYIDNTSNLSKSGIILWTPNTINDWEYSSIPDNEDGDFYWIRLRTSSVPTISPIARSLSIGTDKRFAVYSARDNYIPNFYIDSIGRINIGGGTITGNNKFQINSSTEIDLSVTATNSVFEIDSEDSNFSDMRMRLSSDDSYSTGIVIVKTRGTLKNASGVLNGDEIGHIIYRARIDSSGVNLSKISTIYTGNGTSKYADLIFSVSNGSDVVEKVRINNIGTGFDIIPTAKIHITSGSTSANSAPLKFTSGNLMNTPEVGAIEFYNDNWYGTITTNNERKTFAFLESPIFTGTPHLPSGTTFALDGTLAEFITSSGGTNNTSLVQSSVYNNYTGQTDNKINIIEEDIIEVSGDTSNKLDKQIFYTYTGQTIPWEQINKSGSSIADLETKDAIDIDYINTNWDINNVSNGLNNLTEYIENTHITGRISPVDVLFGTMTLELIVSGGTGYINYEGFHRKITWSGNTFDTTGYEEGTYYVSIDTNSNINITNTQPNSVENIILGTFYHGGYIGVIQQCGCLAKSSINSIVDSLIRQGIFIYDNGGSVQVSGNSLSVISSACKIQYGLLSIQLNSISSNDATNFKFLNYYNSLDYEWSLNYHFNIMGQGKIYTNRWNDITKNSYVPITGHTVTFTQYSNILTSSSNLTDFDLENSFVYLSGDTDTYSTPVSSVTWNGNITTITLETMYVGTGGTGILVSNYTLPKLPSGKYVKNLIIRSSDNLLFLVLAQTYYNDEISAISGVLPSIPTALVNYAIKMAYIVTTLNDTDLTNKIYDIRPLPYSFREGGQVGGGSSITNHGDLTGLSNDDHLQYLRTDGDRNLTGIQKYQSHPTFTSNTDLIDKKYVDDGLLLKIDISTYNIYTGNTETNINSRLLISDFNIFTGTTLPNNYLKISDFDIFTGTTLPNNYYNKNEVTNLLSNYVTNTTYNIYTGNTETNINSRLLISDFNIFTGTTLPSNFYNKTEIQLISGEIYGAISLKSNLISPSFSGTPTSPTAIADSNSSQIATTAFVIGQASNTIPLMNGSVAVGTSLRYARQDHIHPNDTSKLNVVDFNIFTGVTLPDNYYTKPLTDAQFIKGISVDSTNIGDNRPLVYDSISGKIIYRQLLDSSPSVQIRRTIDYNVTTSWSNIQFDTLDVQNKPSIIYWDDINTDRIYIMESGYYQLTFQTKVTCTTTTTQTSVQMTLNGSTVIDGSDTYVNVFQGEVHPLISSVISYFSEGSYISIQVLRNQTSSTLLASPRFIAIKLDGIVGANGKDGATGSGSNIIIKTNGDNIPNTPHSYLNFTGNAVSVVDLGNSGVTIDINQSVYGTEFQYNESLTISTTTSVRPTFATKMTLNTTTLVGGNYRIMVSYGANKNATNSDFLSRVTVDDITVGDIQNYELSDTSSYMYTTRVFYVTLTPTSHIISLQFSNESYGTVSVKDATIELIRVS